MPFPNPASQFPKGRSGNPTGSSRRAKARARLRELFGGQRVDDEVLLALFAMGTGRPYLLEEAVKDANGNPVIGKNGKPERRQREPDLGFLRELKELLWGKDEAGPDDASDDAEDKPKRIEIPQVDGRAAKRKRARKAQPPGDRRDVPS